MVKIAIGILLLGAIGIWASLPTETTGNPLALIAGAGLIGLGLVLLLESLRT